MAPPRAPPSRCTRSTKVKYTSHRGTAKKDWTAPVDTTSKTLIMGDSNLERFDRLKVSASMGSVDCHSYPGAKLVHFSDHILKLPQPQVGPRHVILSVGLNNRTNRPSTHRDQLKRVINLAQKMFPNARIYIPQINYASDLAQEERASLDSLNSLLMESCGTNQKFHTIPKLSPHLFKISVNDGYRIHWTDSTKESILSHWFQYLN